MTRLISTAPPLCSTLRQTIEDIGYAVTEKSISELELEDLAASYQLAQTSAVQVMNYLSKSALTNILESN